MPNIMVKKALRIDLNEVLALNRKLFENEIKQGFDRHLNLAWLESQQAKDFFADLIDNETVFLSFIDGQIAGYLAGIIHPNKVHYVKDSFGEIFHLYLEVNTRGLGIGKKLIEAFKQHCKTQGIRHVKVTASAPNHKALAFYRKLGFNDYEITLKCEI